MSYSDQADLPMSQKWRDEMKALGGFGNLWGKATGAQTCKQLRTDHSSHSGPVNNRRCTSSLDVCNGDLTFDYERQCQLWTRFTFVALPLFGIPFEQDSASRC